MRVNKKEREYVISSSGKTLFLHERERIPNYETTHGPSHELCRQRCRHARASPGALHRSLAHFILDQIDIRTPIQVPQSENKLIPAPSTLLKPDAKLEQVDVARSDEKPMLVVDEHRLQAQFRAERTERRGGYVRRWRFEEHDQRACASRQYAVDVSPGLTRRPVFLFVHCWLRLGAIGHAQVWTRRFRL